jgi:hypothetical protein
MATFQIIGTIVLVACALGIFYGMFKMSRHDRKDNNGNNHFKSKGTQHKLLAVLLLLIAMGLGQSAWATTKTISYDITYINPGYPSCSVIITRTGDTPFDGSNTTTYTIEVNNNTLGNSGTSGNYSVMLADGFQLSISWSAGSNVTLMSNTFRPGSGKSINCSVVTNPNDYYYVTNLQIRGMEGVWSNTNYDYQWHFEQYETTQYSFGGFTVTYTDYPSLSIFGSAGNNAYKITNKYELQHLANYVNNGRNNCEGLTFIQTKDITGDDSYTPIGFSYNNHNDAPFSGTYDGMGYTLSGITVNRFGPGDENTQVGLFGYISSATIKNIVLTNSTFNGSEHTGGIVGYNFQGVVSNCRVTSSVHVNAGISNAHDHGGITGASYGGFCKVTGCISAAVVSRNDMNDCNGYGGITGTVYQGAHVEDCLYIGNDVSGNTCSGAIVGCNDSGAHNFFNNYYTNINLGGVDGNDENGARRARIITLGENVIFSDNEKVYDVSGLTAIGTNPAAGYVCGALRTSDGTVYCGANQTVNCGNTLGSLSTGYIAVYSSTNGGYFNDKKLTMPDADVSISVAVTDVWGVSASPAADGSEDNPYTITNTDGLNLLAKMVNGTDGYTTNTFSGKFFKLANDIAYIYTSNWNATSNMENNYTVIGDETHTFEGTFDGYNNTIGGIRYRESFDHGYRGLFGRLGNGCTIKNLTLANTRISGKEYTGGIAGKTDSGSKIENCTVANDVDVNYASSGSYHGGIVGDNVGTIKGCLSRATLTIGVTSYNYYGGIAGQNYGTISNCIAWGVTIPKLPNSGIITGYNNGSLVENYYHDCAKGSFTDNIGCENGDCDGARGVYSVTTPSNVTATGDNTVKVGGEDYFIAGITMVTLTSEPLATGYKYHYAYSFPGSSDNDINGNSFLMPSGDTEVASIICRTIEVTGYGTGNDKWVFIASPSANPQPIADVEGLLGTVVTYSPLTYDYDLYRLNPYSMMWESYQRHKNDFISLINGKGYLYATKETKTIAFPEPFVNGSLKDVPLEQGWNLVGNPFIADAYVNRAFYRMNAEGTGIEPVVANFDEFVPTKIPACTGIVVYAETSDEKVNFIKDVPVTATNDQGHLTIALTQPVSEPVERAGISTSSTTGTLDKAIVNFNEGGQLNKFYFLEQDANIYLPQGGKEFAIAYSEGLGEMPLNFKARKNGEYTLTVNPEGVKMKYLHLIDNMTGADVDLLASSAPEPVEGPNASEAGPSTSSGTSYTFTAKTTDYASRFKLVFRANNENGPLTGSEAFAFISDGDIVITDAPANATLQILDVTGRVILSGDAINRVSTGGMTAGVYVLRLIDGKDVKTQKIVIP